MWLSYPIIRPVIAVLLGMIGMNALMVRCHFSPFITLTLFAVSVMMVLFLHLKNKAKKMTNMFGLFVLFAFFFFGAMTFQLKFLHVENHAVIGKKVRMGVVGSKPVEKEKWWFFNFKEVSGGKTSLYIAKGGYDHPEQLQVGDSIYVLTYFDYPTSPYQREQLKRERTAKYEKIEEFKRQRDQKKKNKNSKKKTKKGNTKKTTNNQWKENEQKQEKNDSIFEGFKRYLFYQGVSEVAFVSQGAWGFCYDKVQALKNDRNSRPWYHDIAGNMKKHYRMAGFSETAEGIVEAMTTGDKTAISSQTKKDFAAAGISHVLALSGFHLTIIVAFLDVLLLRGVFKRKWRKFTALAIIPFIWAFAFIVGFPPSLVRASFMCSIIQIAMVIGHFQEMKNACGIAAFVMLVWNPMMVMDVGFQLSFMSIVGIATIGLDVCRLVKTKWGTKIGIGTYVADIVVISFTCTIFTFPLVAYHFGQVPIYSIFSNLLISLLAVVFMWAALCWWLFFWWLVVQNLFTSILNGVANAMAYIAEMVANLPAATISFKPNFLVVIIIYVLIALFAKYVHGKIVTYSNC